jgi:hypothetical protein
MNAVQKAKSKKPSQEVDLSTAETDRERAVLMEMKEKSEAIDETAFIVNDKAGNITINDLDISLPLNMPYDLSNISAKRLAISRDLKSLIGQGLIRFVSPEEKLSYVDKALLQEDSKTHGLEVYDSPDEAEAAIGRMPNQESGQTLLIDDSSEMNITDADLQQATEDEVMIMNLTQNMPTERTSSTPTSHSVHGARSSHGGSGSSPRPINRSF